VIFVDHRAADADSCTCQYYWLGKNWDPAVDAGKTAAFDDFCAKLLPPGNGNPRASIGDVQISQSLTHYEQYVTEVKCKTVYTVAL
jgi:hypothetical protein